MPGTRFEPFGKPISDSAGIVLFGPCALLRWRPVATVDGLALVGESGVGVIRFRECCGGRVFLVVWCAFLHFHLLPLPAQTKTALPNQVRRFHRVELTGFEPVTPTLPVWCATSCAIAP